MIKSPKKVAAVGPSTTIHVCLLLLLLCMSANSAMAEGMFFEKPISFMGDGDPGEIIGHRKTKKIKEEKKESAKEVPEPNKAAVKKQSAPLKAERKTPEQELFELFAETTVDENGKTSIRLPPKIFMDFWKPENRNKEFARKIYHGLQEKVAISQQLSNWIREVAKEEQAQAKNAEIREVEATSGRPLILTFLSKSCRHCMRQISVLVSVFKRWHDRIDFNAVLVDADRRETARYIDKHRVPFKVDPDYQGLARRLKVNFYPTTFFISGNLKMPLRKVGFANLNVLEDVLAKITKGQHYAPKVQDSGIIKNENELDRLLLGVR
jgi:thioredoxin-related protein